MQIREEQFDMFEKEARDRSADQVIDFATKTEPESIAGADREELRARAHDGMARARERGLRDESAVGLFASLELIVGPGFDREPECSRILDDPELPADGRMQKLLAPGSTVPWKEIGERLRRQSKEQERE